MGPKFTQGAQKGQADDHAARLRDLIEHALALPPTERAAYLDSTCNNDVSLRAEVRELLGKISDPKSATALAVGALLRILKPEQRDPFKPGSLISHYEIIGKIGEGGMGAVYKAVDIKLGRPVAMKVISGAIASSEDKQRFAREAKAASALNHPNIVTIYEYNTDSGIDFIAMEFVEGEPFDRVLADRNAGENIPLDRLLGYAGQVASALSKAHAARVVHRDLKPGNIIITPEGVAKVLDFGLAKQETLASGNPDAQETELVLTQLGSILGTPSYLSPEAAMGDTPDWRTDIFSFGVIVYEIVAGTRPFKGANASATMRQIIQKQPPPINNPAVAPEVIALIEKCLKKDRDERLQSLDEAAGILRGNTQSNTAISIALPVQSSTSRRKWALAGALSVAAVGSLFLPAVRNPIRRLLSSASETAFPRTAADLTTEGRQYLKYYYRKGYIDKAIDSFQRALARDPEHAPAYAGIASALWFRFLLDADRTDLEKAQSNAAKAVQLNPQLSAAHLALGWVNLDLGLIEPAAAEFQKVTTADPLNAEAIRGTGAVYRRQRLTDQAVEAYNKAIQLRPDDWLNHLQIGNLFYQTAKYKEAESAFRKVTELAPDFSTGYKNLGAMFYMQGRYGEAAAQWQKCLELSPTANIYANLGTTYFAQGLYQESVQAMLQAINLGANNSLNWGNLADAYRWTPGNEQKAKDAYLRAIQLLKESLKKSPNDGDLHTRLAMYLAKRGDTAEALEELRFAEKLPRLTPNMLYRMVVAYEVAGRRDDALRSLAAAVAASYSISEIGVDPELAKLRKDPRYHQIVMNAASSKK